MGLKLYFGMLFLLNKRFFVLNKTLLYKGFQPSLIELSAEGETGDFVGLL